MVHSVLEGDFWCQSRVAQRIGWSGLSQIEEIDQCNREAQQPADPVVKCPSPPLCHLQAVGGNRVSRPHPLQYARSLKLV